MDRPDREVCRACSTKGNEPVNSCQIVSSYSGKRFMFFAIVIIKNHSCFPTSLVNFDSPHDKTVFNHVPFRLEIELFISISSLWKLFTKYINGGCVERPLGCSSKINLWTNNLLLWSYSVNKQYSTEKVIVLYPFSGGFGNLSRKFINYKF